MLNGVCCLYAVNNYGVTLMKKILVIFLILLTLFTVASCTPEHETITQNPGKYVYSLGEEIIITDIETGDIVAALTINNCTVCNTEPIEVYNNDKSEESHLKYDYLLCVTYDFEPFNGYKGRIDSDNFSTDGVGKVVDESIDFDIKDDVYKMCKNSNAIFILSDTIYVTLEFRYDEFQERHTAKIDLNSVYDPKDDTETTFIISQLKDSQDKIKELNKKVEILWLISVVLLIATVALSIWLIVHKKSESNHKGD